MKLVFNLLKARSHKYISRKKDSKGNWIYTYPEEHKQAGNIVELKTKFENVKPEISHQSKDTKENKPLTTASRMPITEPVKVGQTVSHDGKKFKVLKVAERKSSWESEKHWLDSTGQWRNMPDVGIEQEITLREITSSPLLRPTEKKVYTRIK